MAGASGRLLFFRSPAGTFEEWDANLASEDFLSFPGYADKLKSVSERSGELTVSIHQFLPVGYQKVLANCILPIIDTARLQDFLCMERN